MKAAWVLELTQQSNLPGATCIGIVDGGACTNGAGRTGIGTDLAELNLPQATINPRIDRWMDGRVARGRRVARGG